MFSMNKQNGLSLIGIYSYFISTTIANLLASFGLKSLMPPRLTAFICDFSMPLLMNCLAM